MDFGNRLWINIPFTRGLKSETSKNILFLEEIVLVMKKK